MKSLVNILNHLKDNGKKISLNIFLTVLTSYILGIVLWYQYINPYFLILGLIITPLMIFIRNFCVFFLIISIFFFSLGALRTSFTSLSEIGDIEGFGRIITFPKKTDYYNEAKIDVKTASKNIYSYLTIRTDKENNLKPLDFIYFNGIEKKRLHYRNENDYPLFYENFLSNRHFIKANILKKIDENKLINNLLLIREKIKEGFFNSQKKGKYFYIEILFGEKILEEEIRDIFNKTGTAHILSISGLHFGLLVFFSYLFIYALTTLFPKILLKIPRTLLTIFFALPLLVIYAFLSGLSIPSTRAFIIFITITIFLLLKKNPNYFSLLSLIALIFLIFDPTYFFSTSFQLSFASVFALIIFGEKINNHLINKINNKILKYFSGILLASLSVNIFIFPIITNLQGKISFLSGFISNIIVIPLFSFLILPFLFVSLPFSIFNHQIFSLILTIPEIGFKALLFVLSYINNIFDRLSFDLYFNYKAVLIYYFAIILILYLPRYFKLIPLVLISITFLPYKDVSERNFSAVFLDVGQGESALVQSKNGNIIMIDCGGNIYDESIYKKAYAPFFRKHNIKEIYGIIISHYHPDHTIALKELLKNIKVRNIFLTEETKSYLKDSLTNTEIFTINHHKKLFIDDLEIELLPPNYNDKKANNNSLWAIIKFTDKTFIFTGDTESKYIEKMLGKIRLDSKKKLYLKVPHHGSMSSFHKEMYIKLKPHSAIISVGIDNIWKLPSREVLSFLNEKRIRVLRTDILGQITVQ